ncbi:MAG: tetratricopeptide repeat protein [Thermoanaerobaculia bacterium]|nr:tetratricopeptide repeat protein [Thermoanaerobaculia bacterium]
MPTISSIRTLRYVLVLSLLGALATAPLLAQAWVGKGRLQGIVTDQEGEPIEDAKVTLRRQGAGEDAGPDPLYTNEKGRWSYLGLGHGNWEVTVEKEGMIPSQGVVPVNEFGRNPNVKVSLRPIPENKAEKLFDQANELFEAQRWDEARAKYQEVLSEVEDDYKPAILDRIARTYLAQEMPEQAIETLEKAHELAPTEPVIMELLIRSYVASERAEEAIPVVEKALEASPEDPDLLSLQAQAYYEAGKTDEAITILQELVEQDRADDSIDNPKVLQTLVDLQLRSGHEEEADKYMALMPEGAKVSPETLLNTGIEAFNAGDLDKAIKFFDRAIQDNPDMADGYYYRGLAYLNQQKNAEAKSDFQKFMEMAPEHPKAEEVQQFLDYLDSEA